MTIRKQMVQIIIHLWMNDSRIHRNRGTLLFLPQSLRFPYPNWRKPNGNDFFFAFIVQAKLSLELHRDFSLDSLYHRAHWFGRTRRLFAGCSPVVRRLFAGCSRFLTGLLRISELIFKVSDKCLGRSPKPNKRLCHNSHRAHLRRF